MGSKTVGNILPLIAIAGIGAATGGLGAMGSGVASGMASMAAIQQANRRAGLRHGMVRLREAEAALDLVQKETDSQRRLRRALASQNNFLAAVGTHAGEGSAWQAAQAAKATSDRELSLYGHKRNLYTQKFDLQRQGIKQAQSQAQSAAMRRAALRMI